MTLLTVHHSRSLRVAMVALRISALAAIWLADLPWWVNLLWTLVVGISLVVILREPPPAILRFHSNGTLMIGASDDARAATILPDSLVWSWLVVIRYRLDGQRRNSAMLVLPDSLPKEDFRRLHIWLSWRVAKAGSDCEKSAHHSTELPDTLLSQSRSI